MVHGTRVKIMVRLHGTLRYMVPSGNAVENTLKIAEDLKGFQK